MLRKSIVVVTMLLSLTMIWSSQASATANGLSVFYARNIGHQAVLAQGWGNSGWLCTDYIIMHESAWDVRAHNASGAHGIPQALPGSKMASEGRDWKTSPVTQVRWLVRYLKGRYGGPCQAARHKRATGWY